MITPLELAVFFIVGIAIVVAISKSKQSRPEPHPKQEAVSIARTLKAKPKAKPTTKRAIKEILGTDDYEAKFDIVGESFYKSNIYKLAHGRFYSAKLVETTYKDDYAVDVTIKGKKVGCIATGHLTEVCGHIHLNDGNIRVIVHTGEHPNVTMCKLTLDEDDVFDLMDTALPIAPPTGKVMCADIGSDDIYILLEKHEHQAKGVRVLLPIDGIGENGQPVPDFDENFVVFILEEGAEFDGFIRRGFIKIDDVEHDNYDTEVILQIIK